MRIISGEYRGRRIETLESNDIRPTADRVKESLFNIFGSDVVDCTFLDLFGGSGNVGIEALSRGAKLVVFIDSAIKSIKVLRKNLESLKITEGVEVYNTDYQNAVSRLHKDGRKFDIIFADPPYSQGIAQKALLEIDKNNLLSEKGIVVIEHDYKDPMPESQGDLVMYRQKDYGNTKLSFYTIKTQQTE